MMHSTRNQAIVDDMANRIATFFTTSLHVDVQKYNLSRMVLSG